MFMTFFYVCCLSSSVCRELPEDDIDRDADVFLLLDSKTPGVAARAHVPTLARKLCTSTTNENIGVSSLQLKCINTNSFEISGELLVPPDKKIQRQSSVG